MYEMLGRELSKWRDTIDISKVNEFDVTVINLIIDHYSELAESGGTAAGKRAKKIAEYIVKKNCVCDKTLSKLTFKQLNKGRKIKTIDKVVVDSFRGFSVSHEFDLKKKYVFMYGPNGSGKSSFSEALEYGLLGSIQEADANKIKVSSYIKNTTTNKGKKPIISCTYEDGTTGNGNPDYENYRFAFVEKNRISDFSHISVLNTKTQYERIAALFGLTEFSEFVQGFTSRFDEKYLSIISETEKNFTEKQVLRDSKEKQIGELEGPLKEVEEQIDHILLRLAKEEINSVSDALKYIDNPDTGVLPMLMAERAKANMKCLDEEEFKQLKNLLTSLNTNISCIISYKEKLANQTLQVDYKNMFEAIVKLEEGDVCPACGTPLNLTTRNPYEYARKELNSLAEIAKIQEKISAMAKECQNDIIKIKEFVNNHKKLIEVLEMNSFDMLQTDVDDFKYVTDLVSKWEKWCQDVICLENTYVTKKISDYNLHVTKKNQEYDTEINHYSDIRTQLTAIEAQRKEKQNLINKYKEEIKEFDLKCEKVLAQIEKEKQEAIFNKSIIEAYSKVMDMLLEYNRKLPEIIAKNLENRIVDYYNVINQDDADFEKIVNIELPTGESDKLLITFGDGNVSEALQVLSEGHIKILGLSILLAKAVQDKLNFIIFDDIVNAIDDDHRNGVAELLMNHVDFATVQIILSTHGDQFIFKLQDKLGKSRSQKDAVIYKFIPADSLDERGVIVEYSDAKAPLLSARKKYESSELKDSASKCRQAMESISYNLWNVIAKTPDGMISVGMRSPKSMPDLRSIVDALIKKTKKIVGMENINEELLELTKDSNWRVLNKGTHYEDEQKEFDRADVKNVLEHMEKLDDLVRNTKIEHTAKIINS